MLPNCSGQFFIHLKLELLTQYPAPNDEKQLDICKNIPLQNVIIRLTNHLPQNILEICVEFILFGICRETDIYGPGRIRGNNGHICCGIVVLFRLLFIKVVDHSIYQEQFFLKRHANSLLVRNNDNF